MEASLKWADSLFEKSDDSNMKLESFSYLASSSANWAKGLIAMTWPFVHATRKLKLKMTKSNYFI